MSRTVTVRIRSDKLILHGVAHLPRTGALPVAVLFLHGGGTASSGRYTAWQTFLSNRGILSLSFDFRGCGRSEGRFRDGSLANRLRDADASYGVLVGDFAVHGQKIVLAGSSMGGHVACRLTEIRPSNGLILQSAAAYGQAAESLPLDPGFSNEIRRRNSFGNSPAVAAVNAYPNPVLCVYGAQDDVVPEAVRNAYLARAGANGRACIIREYGHTMLHPESPAEKTGFRKLMTESYGFLQSLLSADRGLPGQGSQ